MAVDTDETPDSSRPSHRSLAVGDSIRSSLPLQAAAAGLVLIGVGFALGSGVWAGMLPIWGFAAVLIGLGAHAAIIRSRRGSKG